MPGASLARRQTLAGRKLGQKPVIMAGKGRMSVQSKIGDIFNVYMILYT